MPALTLYIAPGASSMAPHIMLHEVGAPFALRPLSLGRKENRDPAYLALNPEGKVPTLVVDGARPLTEVAAILFYLARTHPEAGLFPRDDPEAEAQVLSWMSFIASTVHPARQRGGDAAAAAYAMADRRLGAAGEWASGGRFGIADIHLFRLFWRYVYANRPERADFPHLYRHYDRMMERPAVRRTIEAEAAIGYELPNR